MVKAILIMDMPDNCHECPVRYYDIMRDISHCHITGNIILDDTDKLDLCPLIPEPERMAEWAEKPEARHDLDYEMGRAYMTGITDGWNGCLDALEDDNDNG